MNPKSDLQPIPLTIITGFLGSGKTTLLSAVGQPNAKTEWTRQRQ